MAAGGTAKELRERLDALVAGHERRCAADEEWLYLFDPRMPPLDHGWKLHVSARADDFSGTFDLLVPVLLRYVCEAKFAVSTDVLAELNAGVRDPAVVGKAVTVYPRGQDVAVLGRELAGTLAGRAGPRVLSDRRVRPDAPVYYRYGPFRATGSSDSELVMTGPDGQRSTGRAGTRYRQPPWATDPFGAAAPGAPRAARPVGGRYRLTTGIVRSPHGDVYRAVDTGTGERVVVKQARAYTGEDDHGTDARGRLRNERTVLAALDGLDGVPRVVDHLRHGEDEYLVTTDCGPRDLRRDVLENGPYRDSDRRTGRRASALAGRLLAVLDEVHARGVVVCDLKPGNVVIGADGTCRLVDFGISALGTGRPAGATHGYSLPVYRAGSPPDPADDYYALGATLHYALTGMHPVVVDPDHVVNRDRTLACLAAALPGATHRPIRALVAGLLSLDPGERTATAGSLRTGLPVRLGGRRLPAPPRITDGLLDEVIAHTVSSCVRAAPGLPAGPGGRRPGSTLTLYAGAAGVGLELLHHTDRPGVPEALAALAHRAAHHPELGTLPPALYTGRTGVDLFLAYADRLWPGGGRTVPGRSGGDRAGGGDQTSDRTGDRAGDDRAGDPGRSGVRTVPGRPRPDRNGGDRTGIPGGDRGRGGDPAPDPGADQIGGAAGIGTGLLLLAGRARTDGREQVAAGYVAAAGECAAALLAHDHARAEPEASALPPASSRAAYADGFAHGRAGVVHFLYAYHRATADPAAGTAAQDGLAGLAARTPDLLAAVSQPGATRRYGSWCRGLAGTGALLTEVGAREREPDLLELGLRCAWACHALAPRMSLVSQCCGLSGVGELLVDAAVATGDDALWRAAEDVVGLILARSGGTPRRPLLPDNTLTGSDIAWATGSAGVLSLLRRLRDRGGPRLCAPAPAAYRS